MVGWDLDRSLLWLCPGGRRLEGAIISQVYPHHAVVTGKENHILWPKYPSRSPHRAQSQGF